MHSASHKSRARNLPAVVAVVLLACAALALPSQAAAAPSPFNTPGMWIWYVNQAEGGNPVKIAARAKRFGIKTVYIKSGDGSTYWSQFDAAVAPLKALGLRVCAWQYVYGANPSVEAALGARAVAAGADCLVIDAETEYNNRYAAAQTYITQLRSAVGPNYPVGLTSFAYPDYHPNIPYSVFLGPGGAQWNLPQMYFKAFGQAIPAVFIHTYAYNQLYGRRIHPLGQTYDGVRASQVIEFRKYARYFGARGYSWWVWNQTRVEAYKAMRRKLHRSTARVGVIPYPVIAQGIESDVVRWAQLHLVAAGITVATDGNFNAAMTAAVTAFQTQRGIPPSGILDQPTWQSLLAVQLPAATASGPG